MKQYCRYCAFCFDLGDWFGCSNHPKGEEPYMTRSRINRENNCPNFGLSDLGDIETGKQYRPRKGKAKRHRYDKSEQLSIFDLGKENEDEKI